MCLGRIERLADVWDAGSSRQGRAECGAVLSLAFTPEALPGSFVLAHAGVAVKVLDPADAEEALALREAGGA
ncbi:MAG TPA: HypC/HybG/HupF family hydrogenase formation chaperone [Gaiellaceae bacterium]|nr:HypC/HybG/HupF family hydrogenase formation chaperone [Gaiellaceae bacterium]